MLSPVATESAVADLKSGRKIATRQVKISISTMNK
jgi:hypothetical protein